MPHGGAPVEYTGETDLESMSDFLRKSATKITAEQFARVTLQPDDAEQVRMRLSSVALSLSLSLSLSTYFPLPRSLSHSLPMDARHMSVQVLAYVAKLSKTAEAGSADAVFVDRVRIRVKAGILMCERSRHIQSCVLECNRGVSCFFDFVRCNGCCTTMRAKPVR